ncbi:MAG: serine/threonine protein kinase, partial [bacterium]|nr:serine/threonine protein kinase [bacterium]
CLGEGGFAVVWSAVPEEGSEAVAIKVGHVSTGKLRQHFTREAAALRRVGAPYVPEVYDSGTLADGRPYLVMELLEGAPLATHLGKLDKAPDITWVHGVGDAILGGLEAVHKAGLVHGDLKPDNVFIDFTDDGVRARLLDFGIVRSATTEHADEMDEERTKEEVVGSAEYMAPEQFDGHADTRADLYAAGVLLYELLTLRVPFVGDLASI